MHSSRETIILNAVCVVLVAMTGVIRLMRHNFPQISGNLIIFLLFAVSAKAPFTIVVESNHTSAVEQGYMKLFIPCGGADSPRPIKLRMKGDGRWFLWEQYLMTNIRQPKSADPWA